MYQWQGKKAEADADYKTAFKLDSKNAVFHWAQGRGLMNLNRFPEAIKSLRKAAAIEPNNPRIYKKLCETYTKTKDFKTAKDCFERVRTLTGKDYEVEYLDCERLRANGEWDLAIKRCNGVPLEAGGALYTKAQIAISKVYRDSRKPSKAVTHMTDYLENKPKAVQPPQIAEVWCELGQAYEAIKNKEKSMQCYIYGVEQFPLYPGCHYQMCRAMDRRDPDKKQACQLYLKVAPRGEHVAEVKKHLKRAK